MYIDARACICIHFSPSSSGTNFLVIFSQPLTCASSENTHRYIRRRAYIHLHRLTRLSHRGSGGWGGNNKTIFIFCKVMTGKTELAALLTSGFSKKKKKENIVVKTVSFVQPLKNAYLSVQFLRNQGAQCYSLNTITITMRDDKLSNSALLNKHFYAKNKIVKM